MVDKVKRFVFPPSFDFVNFPLRVDPIAMYIFEFSTTLDRRDLTDIWQNLYPSISRSHEEEEITIRHSLKGVIKERLISNKKLRPDIRWMVFKVKQRAASRYYDQVFTKQGDKNPISDFLGIEADPAGPLSSIQFNWPYDFFSLVELVKIDTAVKFSDVEEDDDGNIIDVAKEASEESSNIDLTNLFPKSNR
jgi:hypothetical protein